MSILLYSYSIYHSPNAYLGVVLLKRAVAGMDGVRIVRRPIYVPRARGVLLAEMLGGKENRNMSSYNREDCRRWAVKFDIPFSYPDITVFMQRMARWREMEFHREELPARAYYAAPYERKDAFDDALFQAAWVEGLDVNEVNTVRWAAEKAELDPDGLLEEARSESAAREASAALAEFDRLLCPGVPTVVLDGSRYYGKDRLDWILEHVSRIQHQAR